MRQSDPKDRRVFMFDKANHICIYLWGENMFLSESLPVGEKCSDDWLTLWLCKPSAVKANIPLLSLIIFFVVTLQQETLN